MLSKVWMAFFFLSSSSIITAIAIDTSCNTSKIAQFVMKFAPIFSIIMAAGCLASLLMIIWVL